MKNLFYALLLSTPLLALAGDPAPAGDESPKPKKDPETLFKNMDHDHDGFLTEKEFFAKKGDNLEQAKKAFAALDKDADGKISLQEYLAKKKK